MGKTLMTERRKTNQRGTVYVVDDDAQARRGMSALLSTLLVDTEEYDSAERFLEAYDGRRPACLVTDVRMLGMSGLELQERLRAMGLGLAVVVITAHASTPSTVRAMRNGAFTLLEKPCSEDALWNAVRKALAEDKLASEEEIARKAVQERMASLTPRESRVLELIVAGDANKLIARKLDVSIRTVENHRSRVFEKMQADSLAELVRTTILADSSPSEPTR